jgi:hypothetical protein
VFNLSPCCCLCQLDIINGLYAKMRDDGTVFMATRTPHQGYSRKRGGDARPTTQLEEAPSAEAEILAMKKLRDALPNRTDVAAKYLRFLMARSDSDGDGKVRRDLYLYLHVHLHLYLIVFVCCCCCC